MKLAPVRTVAPAVPVVTLSEAKVHCRIDGNDEDLLVNALIKAATDHLDGYSGILGRALITQTWQLDLSGFCSPVRLPVGNLQAVSGVTYYDTANALQTLSGSVYGVYSDALGPFLELKTGQSWPSLYTRSDAVSITWTAGYGDAAADVPAPIKQAILFLVDHWYENRGAVTVGSGITTTELPFAVKALISPFSRIPL